MPRINFDKLSKSEQRVVIAKDLIKRLDAKEFIAQHGTYFAVALKAADTKDAAAEVREVLKGKRCKGCQIGGMFLCAVDRHNKLTLDDVGDLDNNESDMRRYLRQWFTDGELGELESAFEGWACSVRDYGYWKERRPAARMRAIAENIIHNKGRFVGSQLLKAANV